MIISIPLDVNEDVQMIYTELLDLETIGTITNVKRVSHVEPCVEGGWTADMSPVGGPVLGPFKKRSEALREEEEWVNRNFL